MGLGKEGKEWETEAEEDGEEEGNRTIYCDCRRCWCAVRSQRVVSVRGWLGVAAVNGASGDGEEEEGEGRWYWWCSVKVLSSKTGEDWMM